MRTRLAAVGEEEAPDAGGVARPPAAVPRMQSAGTALLITALKALSQRAVIALASIVDLLLIGSVFWICFYVIADAKPMQLVGVGGYSVFVLASLALRKRG